MAYAIMWGDMPCWTKIYAIFWDRDRARFPEKKSKAQKHIQMVQRCALDFFSKKRARSRSRVLLFFNDSRIRVEFQIDCLYLIEPGKIVMKINLRTVRKNPNIDIFSFIFGIMKIGFQLKGNRETSIVFYLTWNCPYNDLIIVLHIKPNFNEQPFMIL